jgi:K(+)-stimulated pyrophosphate-energized sodium pump
MNLVALLIAPAIVTMSLQPGVGSWLRYVICAVAVLIVVVSMVISKRRPIAVGEEQINVAA